MGEFPQPLRRRPGGSDQRTQAVRGPVGLYLRGAHCRHLPTRPWPVRCQGYRTELVDPEYQPDHPGQRAKGATTRVVQYGGTSGSTLCANDDETPTPYEFRLGHRRTTSWL